MKKEIRIVILAGGQGKRMQSDLPKVLIPFRRKPLIAHLLESVEESGLDPRPTIVVGNQRELVIRELGDKYEYAVQDEQLGTGHAVLSAKSVLADAENILVIYGDMPFVCAPTIRELARHHLGLQSKITMGVVT